ncbi:MAG TPA: DUF1697 domain-containing protein [Nocardioides sp.]|uniref:DUF1697 domain-containing protein n=1 Tax=Nocardioides sp. TaxID=35761 RepID=UPI002D0E834D|nr:DUF1697 domain-containing protein [Nocardioides sp.]HQR25410.1 DUF1697 domain-containing protein [Nocardioides sp.]
MPGRIVMLRAVNVGGATLPMADLREIAEDLGATQVRTYIASGNLLCRPPGDPADFDRALEAAVQVRFGFHRECISRTVEELQSALEAHPFEVVEPRLSHLYFLLAEPTEAAVDALAAQDWGGDEVAVIGRDLHIRYATGVAGSRLTAPRIAKALGVQGTGRNIATVRKLIELARP